MLPILRHLAIRDRRNIPIRQVVQHALTIPSMGMHDHRTEGMTTVMLDPIGVTSDITRTPIMGRHVGGITDRIMPIGGYILGSVIGTAAWLLSTLLLL